MLFGAGETVPLRAQYHHSRLTTPPCHAPWAHFIILEQLASRVLEERLTEVGQIKGLEKLNLAGLAMNDANLQRLAGMTQLRELVLSETLVTDAGLKTVAGLKDLRSLNL